MEILYEKETFVAKLNKGKLYRASTATELSRIKKKWLVAFLRRQLPIPKEKDETAIQVISNSNDFITCETNDKPIGFSEFLQHAKLSAFFLKYFTDPVN